MKKKYQVVLPDWIEEYLEILSDKYELTISELLRLELSLAFICFVTHYFPEYKGPAIEEISLPIVKKSPPFDKIDKEETHRVLSKIYFEARKAVDFHLKKEKQGE